MSDFRVALVAGLFALGGVVLGGLINWLVLWRQRVAEDRRRWLSDRRTLYANYLGIASSMLQEIDSLAVFLRHWPADPMPSDEDRVLVKDGLTDYFVAWDGEVQPALGEVQLLASEKVADLADRVSTALIELTFYLETEDAFTEYYPTWFQSKDLVDLLRDAMRKELGLPELKHGFVRREEGFPWLADRPSRESYMQAHHTPKKR